MDYREENIDLSYINDDNYNEIIERIDYVINKNYKYNKIPTPKDIIDLIYLKNSIIRRFKPSYNFNYRNISN